METQRASDIMGRNFVGVEEGVKQLKLEPTPEQLDALKAVPFSEALLQRSKDTHVLVAVLPVSVLNLLGKVDRSLFYNQTWYRSGNDAKSPEPFAQDPGEASWQLLRKTPVAGSTSKNWEEQLALLGDSEEVPPARVMIYATVAHYLVSGERMFESAHARTSTIDSASLRVGLGDFDSNGLFLGAWWDAHRNAHLGLTSSLKPSSR